MVAASAVENLYVEGRRTGIGVEGRGVEGRMKNDGVHYAPAQIIAARI